MSASSNHYLDPSDKIWSFVVAIAVDEKLSLYDLIRPSQSALRIFVDKPKTEEGKKGSGVTSGDCSSLCKRLMHAFVVDGPELGLSAEPELEVSSPGLERELRLPEHFKAVIGEKIKLVAKDRFISGILQDFSKEIMTIKQADNKAEERISFHDVKKGQLVFY